jgi:hypothetical protein
MKGAANLLSTIILAWFIYAGIAGFCDYLWHSKFRYSMQYGVDFSQITQPDKPRDCSFLKAPLGVKGCHYDRDVESWLVKTSCKSNFPDPGDTCTGTVSYDNGKTWQPTSDLKSAVYVTWQRVDDE